MPVKIEELLILPINGEANAQTSTICEPSLCCFGKNILYTGNWFAYKSIDKGKHWQFLNPETFFPSPGVEFDCDQTVIYDPSRKLTFWILQYDVDKNGENVLRIAVNRTSTLSDTEWYWWDLKPSQKSSWRKQWFDFNHAALSEHFLYLGSNMYDKKDNWKRGIIFKLSLDKLADPRSRVSYSHFATTKYGSLRCVLGAKQTMYFASAHSDHQLRVFEWPEKSRNVLGHLVDISPFNPSDSHMAITPDRKNWLRRCDDRITAAWISKGKLGFMWTAAKQKGRPFPYIKCVRVDAKKFVVIDEPDIWSNEFAYAWPDVCPNDNGLAGITLFRGGGKEFPDHLIGVFNEKGKTWELKRTKNGTHAHSKWGDYITCRKHSPNGKTWIASGFVLSGGKTRNNIKPLFVHFSV